jgi:hypothetical protein
MVEEKGSVKSSIGIGMNVVLKKKRVGLSTCAFINKEYCTDHFFATEFLITKETE